MKKFFIAMIILLPTLCQAQNLNIKFLEQVTEISFLDIDWFMIEGYGYKKMREKNDGKELTYMKIIDKNLDSAIVIEVLQSIKVPINTLSISVAKNFDIQKIKSDFIENDYLFYGENEYGFLVYKKDNKAALIAKDPNAAGAYQILIVYNEK